MYSHFTKHANSILEKGPASASSVERAFKATELLEAILLYLHPKDLLLAQNISKTFRDTIKGSKQIRCALGIELRDIHAFGRVAAKSAKNNCVNILATEMLVDMNSAQELSRLFDTGEYVLNPMTLLFIKKTKVYKGELGFNLKRLKRMYHDSSSHEMHLTFSPTIKVEIAIKINFKDRRSKSYVKSACVKRENGVTIGDFVQEVESIVKNVERKLIQKQAEKLLRDNVDRGNPSVMSFAQRLAQRVGSSPSLPYDKHTFVASCFLGFHCSRLDTEPGPGK